MSILFHSTKKLEGQVDAFLDAVIGVGLVRGARELDIRMLGGIALGWVATPLIAALICLVSLFIVQNVFDQSVYQSSEPSTGSISVGWTESVRS